MKPVPVRPKTRVPSIESVLDQLLQTLRQVGTALLTALKLIAIAAAVIIAVLAAVALAAALSAEAAAAAIVDYPGHRDRSHPQWRGIDKHHPGRDSGPCTTGDVSCRR